MSDLTALNRIIAEFWLGHLDKRQEEYLNYVPVCLGRFIHNTDTLRKALAGFPRTHDLRAIVELNRRYLRFACGAANEALSGKTEMLVMLGVTLPQADLLANLTERQIDELAYSWDGPIIRFTGEAFTRGAALDARAAKHHAMALVTTLAYQGTHRSL